MNTRDVVRVQVRKWLVWIRFLGEQLQLIKMLQLDPGCGAVSSASYQVWCQARDSSATHNTPQTCQQKLSQLWDMRPAHLIPESLEPKWPHPQKMNPLLFWSPWLFLCALRLLPDCLLGLKITLQLLLSCLHLSTFNCGFKVVRLNWSLQEFNSKLQPTKVIQKDQHSTHRGFFPPVFLSKGAGGNRDRFWCL